MIRWGLFLCVLCILQHNAWSMDKGNNEDVLNSCCTLILPSHIESKKISHPPKRKYKEEFKDKDEKLSFDLEAFIEKSDKKQKHQGKIVMKSKGDESEEIDIIN